MSSIGPLSAATFANDASVGTIDFSNLGNAASSNDSYASAILLLSQVSKYFKATNFGFSVPLDAVITGILVEVERSATLLTSLVDSSLKLVKAGTPVGSDKASGTNWPTSDAYASYGSATDLWSTTWTPSEINASNFGVALSASALAGVTANIDHIRVTVYWTGSNRAGSQAGNKKFNAGGMGQSDFLS